MADSALDVRVIIGGCQCSLIRYKITIPSCQESCSFSGIGFTHCYCHACRASKAALVSTALTVSPLSIEWATKARLIPALQKHHQHAFSIDNGGTQSSGCDSDYAQVDTAHLPGCQTHDIQDLNRISSRSSSYNQQVQPSRPSLMSSSSSSCGVYSQQQQQQQSSSRNTQACLTSACADINHKPSQEQQQQQSQSESSKKSFWKAPRRSYTRTRGTSVPFDFFGTTSESSTAQTTPGSPAQSPITTLSSSSDAPPAYDAIARTPPISPSCSSPLSSSSAAATFVSNVRHLRWEAQLINQQKEDAERMIHEEPLLAPWPYKEYKSATRDGNVMYRGFCTWCGGCLTMRNERNPQAIEIQAGSLDDPKEAMEIVGFLGERYPELSFPYTIGGRLGLGNN